MGDDKEVRFVSHKHIVEIWKERYKNSLMHSETRQDFVNTNMMELHTDDTHSTMREVKHGNTYSMEDCGVKSGGNRHSRNLAYVILLSKFYP